MHNYLSKISLIPVNIPPTCIQTLYEREQFEKKYSLLTRTLGKNNQIILPSISCLKYPGPAHDGVN